MIFCFVRETKQLTLEELDRMLLSSWLTLLYSLLLTFSTRGLLGSNKGLPQIRNDRVASLVHQAIRFVSEGASSPSHLREAGERQCC